MNIIKNIISAFKPLLKSNYWGFLSPYVDVSKELQKELSLLISSPNKEYIENFEAEFSSFVGGAYTVTFASGRMAFYSILKSLNLKSDDEVILTGFTCAVMANAVLRAGAQLKYADIDENTLGTSYEDLKNKITAKTKVVVVQHSFGIPCDIDKISTLAKERGIYLIEDCALTLGSKLDGIMCGNWGDAAIFSTDHTKPLNSLIGGIAYIKDLSIYKSVKDIRDNSQPLSREHQSEILRKYIQESRSEKISHKLYALNGLKDSFRKKIFKKVAVSPYLSEDFTHIVQNGTYPYPAQMPSFVAYIALLSLKNYINTIEERKECLNTYLRIVKEPDLIPAALSDKRREVVPLRFPFLMSENHKSMFDFTDGWIFFKQPIIATSVSLENLGYHIGDCMTSEHVGTVIMNLPIELEENKRGELVKLLSRIYKTKV